MNTALTAEQLKALEEFAYGLLTPKEICIVMQLDFEAFKPLFAANDNPVSEAYQKGKLQLRYELNVDNIKFATQGNSHAMNMVVKQVKLNELKEKEQLQP